MADHAFIIQPGARCLDGHFPNTPIVPGVVMLDQVARAVATGYGGRVAGIPRCKFVGELLPGQRCEVELVREAGPRLRFTCNGPAGCVAHGLLDYSPVDDG